MRLRVLLLPYLILLLAITAPAWAETPAPQAETADVAQADAPDAQAIVDACFRHMRGKASISTVDMTIHRPDWERTMTIDAWTKGESESIFLITAPPKDSGNGTLKKGREMWIYNPKVNRVIKLPPSMMSQSWMGSDLSNNDIAKSDSLITDYEHTIEDSEVVDGHTIYTVKSMPKPAAPVVWGMLRLKIRDDGIMLSEEFFDEDLESVKIMTTLEIRMVGDRLYPMLWRMRNSDTEDRYTELDYKELEFLDDLPDDLFSLTNLRTQRR